MDVELNYGDIGASMHCSEAVIVMVLASVVMVVVMICYTVVRGRS